MPEIDAMDSALVGKAKRVVGIFILMFGGGIMLESSAVWIGAILVLIGAVAFVWGAVEARPKETAMVGDHERPSAAAATPPTGGTL